MRLHLTTKAPWVWAASWSDSDALSAGAIEHVDPEGRYNWPSRILHAIAEAALAYEDEVGELPAEIELCLSSVQIAGAGDILRKLDQGPWATRDEARLANLLLARGIRISVRASTRQELAYMRESADLAGRSEAVGMMAGMGVGRG